MDSLKGDVPPFSFSLARLSSCKLCERVCVLTVEGEEKSEAFEVGCEMPLAI